MSYLSAKPRSADSAQTNTHRRPLPRAFPRRPGRRPLHIRGSDPLRSVAPGGHDAIFSLVAASPQAFVLLCQRPRSKRNSRDGATKDRKYRAAYAARVSSAVCFGTSALFALQTRGVFFSKGCERVWFASAVRKRPSHLTSCCIAYSLVLSRVCVATRTVFVQTETRWSPRIWFASAVYRIRHL